MWHSTSPYDTKPAVVTRGGGGGGFLLHYSCLIQKINNTGKVCTNRTLKCVDESTVAVERQ
jgi:hypothetical protein